MAYFKFGDLVRMKPSWMDDLSPANREPYLGNIGVVIGPYFATDYDQGVLIYWRRGGIIHLDRRTKISIEKIEP